MIYESAVVVQPDLDESALDTLKKGVLETISQFKGEVFIEEDWGKRSFPGSIVNYGPREDKKHFLYFMYSSSPDAKSELERKLRINEGVQNFMSVRLGPEKMKEQIVKSYQAPFEK